MTLSPRRLSKEELRIGALIYPERHYWRPRRRSDCANVPRPCPYISCKYHLYIDVNESGALKMNFPDIAPHELVHSCALDVADEGDQTLEEVGELLGLTHERIRQIEGRAFARLLVVMPADVRAAIQ